MRRAGFAPLLSLVLLTIWLLLSGVSPGQVLLGSVLAIAIPPFLRRRAGWHSWRTLPIVLRLAATVLIDIVVSAVALARLILGPHDRLRPGLLRVPLRLQDPDGIVVLASIITMTPGTLTVDVASDRSYLLIHAFDIVENDVEVARIKRRYEKPLIVIFGESAA